MDAGLGAGAPARAHIVACAGCFCAFVFANRRAMSRSGHMGAAILRPIGRGEGAGARARAAAQSAPQDADPIWASALLCSGELFASRLFVIFFFLLLERASYFFGVVRACLGEERRRGATRSSKGRGAGPGPARLGKERRGAFSPKAANGAESVLHVTGGLFQLAGSCAVRFGCVGQG